MTFPFLFAVMFGDAGHGFLLLLLGIYFIKNEDKLGAGKLNDIIQMPFDGRCAPPAPCCETLPPAKSIMLCCFIMALITFGL